MSVSRLFGALLLAAVMVPGAGAQVVPASPAQTVVTFDDIPGAIDILSIPAPTSTEYTSRGLTFSGFGQNGGGVLGTGAGLPNPELSPPNFLIFLSAFSMANGGLIQSPETLSFYPPVATLQFDIGTLGFTCDNTMVLNTEAFAPGGASLGTTSTVVPLEGGTVSFSFPGSGAERMVLTSSHTCGAPGSLFFGVEVFTVDNVAFSFVGQPASKCAQSILDAAGKKAKAKASCYAKAVQKGVPADEACLQKATDQFTKAFGKAQNKGDCLTDTDVATVEGQVDTFINNANMAVTGGAPGPDVCSGKKLTAAGKKAADLVKCHSTAAKKGLTVDLACGTKAAEKFTSSLKQCGTASQLAPVESVVDSFASDVARTASVPTTTTTTTTTSTTTTTTTPPLGQHLSFTTTAGTTNCGSAMFATPADPPLSGEVDSDAAGTTKIADLGLGCLYIGGGLSTIPGSRIPENATTILDSPDGSTLVASFGTGQADCSRGPQETKHCVNAPDTECTEDADCGGFAGACAFDANCFFGPPVLVNSSPATTCVVNTFAADASGTLDLATGTSSVNITLASRVYLTLGQPSVCPLCIDGTCNYGANQGGACTTTNSTLTSLDCLPSPGIFVATLPVELSPLTTSSLAASAGDGLFCPGQTNAGAFGQPTAQAVSQIGSAGGDLSDGLPHASVLVSNFCIPKTNFLALDTLADLPGPGSLSLPGNAQFFSTP